MKVNEIFYSVQGEGRFTGTPAAFVRLAGCNLACAFCDTDFNPFTELSEDEIVHEVMQFPAKHVVITGGEPTLQLTCSLVDKLHAAHRFVQIETNGSISLDEELEQAIDWITCSPKHAVVRLRRIDELKVVYQGQDMSRYASLHPTHADCRYLQPCDVGDKQKNEAMTQAAIAYILDHPEWKLSLQTHKILNVR